MFSQLDKQQVVEKAHELFLKTFPLREIDNAEVRLICQSFRNNNSSLDSCKHLFKKHFEYFYKWAHNNWMVDVFYFRR